MNNKIKRILVESLRIVRNLHCHLDTFGARFFNYESKSVSRVNYYHGGRHTSISALY